MNLSVCLHPVRLYDRTTRTYRLVPCGMCDVCRNRRASSWVNRLEHESKCWKYTLFFTLTYDERSVPHMILGKDYIYRDLCTGEFFDTSNLRSSERKFLLKKKRLEYCSVIDVQKFVKRVRYYHNSINKHYEPIRYYIAAEYGPTTFRPHYHGLFFFNSEVTAQKIDEVLSSSWKFGLVDSSFAKAGAANYVAQYVNSIACLPQIYQFKPFRPFSVFSKSPVIGSLYHSDEEISKLFSTSSPSVRVVGKNNRYVDVPLFKYIENRLYPKCFGFSRLSHLARVALYGCSSFFGSGEWDSFKEEVTCALDYQIEHNCLTPFFKNIYDLFFDKSFDNYGGVSRLRGDAALFRLFSVSKRVLSQARCFGISLDTYVTLIENYYDNKDYFKLKSQLQFEADYVDTNHPLSDLIHIDEERWQLMLLNPSGLSSEDKLYLVQFGIDVHMFSSSSDYRYLNSVEFSKDFLSMSSLHTEISRKNSKTKKKNDYLYLHPEKRIL